MHFPTETRCGNCNGRVRLQKHLWDEFSSDAGIVAGFTQQVDCIKCGSTLLSFIGNSELLFAMSNPKH